MSGRHSLSDGALDRLRAQFQSLRERLAQAAPDALEITVRRPFIRPARSTPDGPVSVAPTGEVRARRVILFDNNEELSNADAQ
jgi:hypothetical protein